MNLGQLFKLFDRAREIGGHSDYVVIGSLSILGLEDDASIPIEMSMSVDVDCYTRTDPPAIFDLNPALGEDSDFHARNGYYLDPVSPSLPSLPEGWEARMNRVERDGLSLWFIDPNDAAVSKYARREPRDLTWVRAGILSGLISLPTMNLRVKRTTFLDSEEEQRVRSQVQADSTWFTSITTQRKRTAKRKGKAP